jgi:hypothetical protein
MQVHNIVENPGGVDRTALQKAEQQATGRGPNRCH